MRLSSWNFRFQLYFCKAICPPPFRVKLDKRSQFIIGTHNEALPVPAMTVSNKDRSPVRIHAGDAAPTPTGFAKIISDGFPSASRDTHISSTLSRKRKSRAWQTEKIALQGCE